MQRFLPIVGLLVLMGCQDKIICAAFQSTYILDDSTRNAYYSYVWQLDEATRTEYLAGLQNGPIEDSTVMDSTAMDSSAVAVSQAPAIDYYSYAGEKVVPWRVRNRTKYGIVKYEPYWLKNYRMRTAPMENVYAPKPPKAPEPVETDYVATVPTDTLAVDSLGIASLDSLGVDLVALEEQTEIPEVVEEEEGPKYLHDYDPTDNFNVEQEYYNKYFGEKLIDRRPKPDLRAIQAADSIASAVPDSLQEKGFSLKGLFKKKNQESDSTAVVEEPVVEDTGNE